MSVHYCTISLSHYNRWFDFHFIFFWLPLLPFMHWKLMGLVLFDSFSYLN
jgi:hypothetical protein